MNVLIVDDHAISRKLLRVTLENENHTVHEAEDGEEALKLLHQAPVEAIISDILMPKMDGFRFCLEVRRNPRFNHLPFIVYTSTYDSPTDRGLANEVGADRFIVKPAAVPVIVQALRETALLTDRPMPEAGNDTSYVLKQYNEGLVKKLEEKNLELRIALSRVQMAHDKIHELNRKLEERVQERTAELSTANKELNRQNSEIQSFYHTLCHELRTPLTSAREFACIVLEGLGGPVTETQKEYLEMARESCDQMRRCLDDLLDAARLDTGKLSLELKQGSLFHVADHVAKACRIAATERSIEIRCELAGGLAETVFDEYRVVQILTNLVNNAMKFTDKGGSVTLNLSASPTRAGFQQISVSDTGCGIPPEQLELIFNRLHQVKQGDAATSHGMGLGLYLCRELARLHGGDVAVESEPGKGSVFTLFLPDRQLSAQNQPLSVSETQDNSINQEQMI